MGHTSLVPQKIESLGVTFTISTQEKILWLLIGVVVYYTLAFVLYAAGDALTLFREIHRRGEEVKARRRLQNERSQESVTLGGVRYRETTPMGPDDAIQAADDSWRLGRLVPMTALLRWMFDYIVPVGIALYAIYCLLVAAPPTPSGSEPLPDSVEWSSPAIMLATASTLPLTVDTFSSC